MITSWDADKALSAESPEDIPALPILKCQESCLCHEVLGYIQFSLTQLNCDRRPLAHDVVEVGLHKRGILHINSELRGVWTRHKSGSRWQNFDLVSFLLKFTVDSYCVGSRSVTVYVVWSFLSPVRESWVSRRPKSEDTKILRPQAQSARLISKAREPILITHGFITPYIP